MYYLSQEQAEGLMLKKATISDLITVTQLAILLWPHHTFDDLKEEMKNALLAQETVIFLSFINGNPTGFAQCQLRYDYVEGTESSPVGYLEGVFVVEGYRNKGIATQLLRHCELWSKGSGCAEFASDCEITNAQSYAFHLKFGFQETNRIICFKKEINTV